MTLFPPEPASLGPCELSPLSEEDAAWAGPVLASLDPWRTLGYQAEGLTAYLTRPDPALHRFTVMANGERSGVLCLRYPWLRGPNIELLAVTLPGHGIGSALIQWASTRTSLTAVNLWATVSGFNWPARAFYHAQGFVEAASLPDLVEGGFPEILLRKRLDTDRIAGHG